MYISMTLYKNYAYFLYMRGYPKLAVFGA